MNTDVGTRYTRKYGAGDEVSSEDLMTAYEAAARLVAAHGDDYLPLFERLDAELQSLEEKERARSRALEVAAASGASGPRAPES